MKTLAALFFPLAVPLATARLPSAVAEGPRLADLAWMAGTWRLATDDGVLEETWSTPEGDAMVGMFRWIRNGHAWLFEIMTIEEKDGALAFHLRHLGPGLEIWDSEFEKKTPVRYPLRSLAEGEAIFENPEREKPRRFVYRRDGDALTVRVEGPEPGSGDAYRLQKQR